MPARDTSGARRTFGSRRARIDDRIQYILRSIECDPSPDISELARRVNLSPSRLSHLFKRETWKSLHSVLADRRLDKAAQLLAETRAPIKEVSYIVGYSHAASFVRAFRRKFCCAPNRYREEAVMFAMKDSWFG